MTGLQHYNDVIINAMASQITSLAIVYLTVNSGTDQRKHQSSAWLAFVRGIHRWTVNSPQKRSVTRKLFPFDDVIMEHRKQCQSLGDLTTLNLLQNFRCITFGVNWAWASSTLFLSSDTIKNLQGTVPSFGIHIDSPVVEMDLIAGEIYWHRGAHI